jgi:hypothetical protein
MTRFAPRCSGLFCVLRDEIFRTDVEWEANRSGWRAGQHSNLQTDHQIDAFACRDLGMIAEELRREEDRRRVEVHPASLRSDPDRIRRSGRGYHDCPTGRSTWVSCEAGALDLPIGAHARGTLRTLGCASGSAPERSLFVSSAIWSARERPAGGWRIVVLWVRE